MLKGRGAAWVVLLALSCGVAGETLLLLRRQCTRAQELLAADFRVLAFASSDLTDSKAKIVEEKLRSMAGVESVRYVSKDSALEELKAEDPQLEESVALLGENPLPAALEIRLSVEEISRVHRWVADLKMPELTEVRFKSMEAQAITQMEMVGRFMDLAMSVAGMIWLGVAAAGLWIRTRQRRIRSVWRTLGIRLGLAMGGALLGIGVIYLIAYPLYMTGSFWIGPSWKGHLLLVVTGALGAGLWPESGGLGWGGHAPVSGTLSGVQEDLASISVP